MVNNDSMDMILAKAQTLIEALPYIQKFNGKRVVVKYGGSAMVDENLKYNVIKDVALLKLIGCTWRRQGDQRMVKENR